MSKGILSIRDICNHQGTHLQQQETDEDTTINVIHDLKFPRKHHTTIAEWRRWKKAIRTLCDKSKVKLRAPIGKWTLDNNKYIKNRQWFLSCDIHTLYYKEQGTW